MSDFMKWLYPRYIRPYLDEVPQEEYYFWADLLHNELTGHGQEALEKAREFTAVHAFLLGLRTGQGLPRQREEETGVSTTSPDALRASSRAHGFQISAKPRPRQRKPEKPGLPGDIP